MGRGEKGKEMEESGQHTVTHWSMRTHGRGGGQRDGGVGAAHSDTLAHETTEESEGGGVGGVWGGG